MQRTYPEQANCKLWLATRVDGSVNHVVAQWGDLVARNGVVVARPDYTLPLRIIITTMMTAKIKMTVPAPMYTVGSLGR